MKNIEYVLKKSIASCSLCLGYSILHRLFFMEIVFQLFRKLKFQFDKIKKREEEKFPTF